MQRLVVALLLFLTVGIGWFLGIPRVVQAGGGDLVCAGEWIQTNCNIDKYTGDHTCAYMCSAGTGGGACAPGTYRCNTGCCAVGASCACGVIISL